MAKVVRACPAARHTHAQQLPNIRWQRPQHDLTRNHPGPQQTRVRNGPIVTCPPDQTWAVKSAESLFVLKTGLPGAALMGEEGAGITGRHRFVVYRLYR